MSEEFEELLWENWEEEVSNISGRVIRAMSARDKNVPKESYLEAFEEEDRDHKKSKMWSLFNDGYTPCEQALEKLPAGQYTIQFSQSRGIYFTEKEVVLDELYILPDSASKAVVEAIREFWGSEEKYRKYNFTWKRGVLLWGPPGSGKTSTVQLIAQEVIKEGGIAVYVNDPFMGAAGLELIRRIEPNRPIVVMFEDLDAIIAHDKHKEAALLSLLDGELQIDNIVFIATTNYPETLDKRIINRPSRFDIVRKIGMPNDDAREAYLVKKNANFVETGKEHILGDWIRATKGFSFAHLKELIVSVEVFGNDFDDTVKRLKKMGDQKISSDQDEGNDQFGFC